MAQKKTKSKKKTKSRTKPKKKSPKENALPPAKRTTLRELEKRISDLEELVKKLVS